MIKIIEEKKNESCLLLPLSVRLTDGIELRPLNKSDAQKAFVAWSHSTRMCPQLLECAAEINPSIGAFAEDGTLAAWVLRSVKLSFEKTEKFHVKP